MVYTIKLILKSLFIQTLMTYEKMQMYGFAFMTNKKWKYYINSNPFFAPLIAKFINMNTKKENIDIISSMSAMLGDEIFWNILKPIAICLALLLLIANKFQYIFLIFIIYNVFIIFFRFFIYNYAKKINYKTEKLYTEKYYIYIPKYIKSVKIALLGVLMGFIMLIILSYLKISILYVIITFLFSIVFLFVKFDIYIIFLILMSIYFIG